MSAVMTAPAPSQLSLMSTAELRAELAKSLASTASSLARLAAIWNELERRGSDLSDLRRRMPIWLPLIANGSLAAEAAIAFSSRPTTIKRLVGMPLDEQRAIASGEKLVTLVVPESKGYTTREICVKALTSSQVDQVLDGNGSIRDRDEQIAILEEKKQPKRPHIEISDRNCKVKADHERQGIAIAKGFAPKGEIIAKLAELSRSKALPDLSIEDSETATIRVTAEEKERLKAESKRTGITEWQLLRKAAIAVGLI